MNDMLVSRRTRPVAIWLLAGVFMIMVQVVLGGITRLTGSGLSITDWDPIMGAIPPLNHQQWMEAFHKYQLTPQARILNPDFTLGDFKNIFFWEWFHRLWARLLGVVFLVPFVIFLLQKRFSEAMIRPMVILFLLGGLQGLVGWIMVQSGLVGDNVSVNPFKLAIHFITALLLLCYTLWFAMKLLIRKEQQVQNQRLRKFTLVILVLLVLQLIYGAFMAGLHAALSAHTWPDINGTAIPGMMFSRPPWYANLANNPITVQFIHRGLAYVITILILAWEWAAWKERGSMLFRKARVLPLLAVIAQVTLGILTVINSTVHIPVALGVIHQFVAMLLLIVWIWMLYLLPRRQTAIHSYGR